ncbi:helix-turn-helix domain-containing protein [Kribbella solani]|uniref:helix-turn-helix domain-containing protein n=1 Tax=Kribbella solani TaxID=236067 RepID=UPI0029B009E1|nr:helix-turn-helix domain-containing protein [Kribbella solani]MDX2971953.1 helix-turn-helix domain-containing protein [Kribbella solani]MDX3001561.1 helix-turn-helix domain-containing protein [Kribbella solani]
MMPKNPKEPAETAERGGQPSVADVVMHPVRLRIIQQLGGRELTTAALRELLPDITPATLYRHVAALVEAGILSVVAERRVRGAVERTLALGERVAQVDQHELQAMSTAQLRDSVLTFLGHFAEDFDRFLAADPELRNLFGIGQTMLYVNTDDLAQLQADLTELLAPYRAEQPGRQRVTLTTALIPSQEPLPSQD